MTKHLPIGKELYKQNALGVKIRHVSNVNEIKKAIRYCITLCGIKKDNLPSEAQKMVLLDFLISEMGRYTLEELVTAFKLAVSGKLGVDGQSYQNFNCVFVSSVLKSYDMHIRNVGFKRESLFDEVKKIDNTDNMSHLKEIINKSIKQKTNLLKTRDYGSLATYKQVSAIAYRVMAKYDCVMTREDKIKLFNESCERIKAENIENINSREYQEFIRIIKKEEKNNRNKYIKLAKTLSESKAFEIWLESKY